MSAEKCFTSGPATAPLIMPDLMVNSDSKLDYKMKNHSSLKSSPVHVVLLKNGRATFSNSNCWPGFDPYITIHQPTSIRNNSDITTARIRSNSYLYGKKSTRYIKIMDHKLTKRYYTKCYTASFE